jgi:SAM-dependent methyltransferase
MRPSGKARLGFYPLRAREAERLRTWISFPSEFSALDPCVGDGVAFALLLKETTGHRHGVELDAYRAGQARSLGVDTLHADTLEVRCAAESLSLLYLNPPYDWEAGSSNNQRLESVFLEHTYRWLKPGGVLLFVIPQPRLAKCARLLAEHFANLRLFRLTEAECLQYKQIVVLGSRRKRHARMSDAVLLEHTRYLEGQAASRDLASLGDATDLTYEVPSSGPIVLTNAGIPLDDVEDLILESAAYRQAARVLLPKVGYVRGKPLTPLHGGHVGLLCTAGMLNGVFGEGEDRHIAHWRSVKFTDHWEEEEEDGTKILHDRERFSHELTLVFANGRTQILTHEKKEAG